MVGALIFLGVLFGAPLVMWAVTGESLAQQWRDAGKRVEENERRATAKHGQKVRVTNRVKVKRGL